MRFLHSIVNLCYCLKIHYSFITQYKLSQNPSNNFLIHHLNYLQYYIRHKITHYNYLFVANPQVAILSNETYNPFTYQKHMMDFPMRENAISSFYSKINTQRAKLSQTNKLKYCPL